MTKILPLLFVAIINCFAQSVIAASETITVRHPMTSFLGNQFQKLVDDYNKDASVTVVSEQFGDYKTGFEETVAADDFDQGPDIMLGSEFTSATMIQNHPGKYIPISDFIDPSELDLLPVLQGFYSFDGQLQSLPFSCSAAAVFYNEDKLANLGVQAIPPTWEQFAQMCRKHNLTFAMAWPMAYVFEHWSIVNGVPFSLPDNGFREGEIHFALNQEDFAKRLAFLRDLKRDGILIYSKDIDRKEIPEFIEGKYDIVMNGANWGGFIQMQKPLFKVGVAPYPYNAAYIKDGQPYTLNVAGNTAWVMNKPHLNRKAVRDFLTYLAKPEVQAKWHQLTGYVPTTYKAYELTEKEGFYKDHPAHKVAFQQMSRPKLKYYGVRANNYAQIRIRLQEAIDKVLLEDQDIQTVLDDLVTEIDGIANKRVG